MLETKINTLKSLLPSIPFVAEQVGFALKYAQEDCTDEAKLTEVLDWAINLTELANKFGNQAFYPYRPILCALLSVVNEDKLEMFATETNSVLTTLAEFKQFLAEFKENTDKCCNTLAKAIMNKSDVVLVCLTWMKKVMETGDLVEKLKIAYNSMNLRLSGFELTGANYEAYNKMLIAVNKAEF